MNPNSFSNILLNFYLHLKNKKNKSADMLRDILVNSGRIEEVLSNKKIRNQDKTTLYAKIISN